jgi:hypothetical protein
MNDLSIRTMRPDEISIAVKWAAAEGWNPGLADDACFAAVDPEGFLIGELNGVPAATVSCVNYSASFAFLGFYIVREDLRGRGYGLCIWDAAVAHAGPRVIGLDGVVAQQQNYRKSGFELAYANVRYGGIVAAPDAPQAGVMALAEVPLAAVEAYDATVFPAPRPAFLRAWIGSPGPRHPVSWESSWASACLPHRKRNRFLIMLALDHHGPSHPGNLVGKCDGGDFGWSPRQQCREPGPILRAMDFGVADDSESAGHE